MLYSSSCHHHAHHLYRLVKYRIETFWDWLNQGCSGKWMLNECRNGISIANTCGIAKLLRDLMFLLTSDLFRGSFPS